MENHTNYRKAYDAYLKLRSSRPTSSDEDLIKEFCNGIDYSTNRALAKQEELKEEILFWQRKYHESKKAPHNDDPTVELLRYVIEDLSLTIRALTGDRPSQE